MTEIRGSFDFTQDRLQSEIGKIAPNVLARADKVIK
jgi:hypothetical protein